MAPKAVPSTHTATYGTAFKILELHYKYQQNLERERKRVEERNGDITSEGNYIGVVKYMNRNRHVVIDATEKVKEKLHNKNERLKQIAAEVRDVELARAQSDTLMQEGPEEILKKSSGGLRDEASPAASARQELLKNLQEHTMKVLGLPEFIFDKRLVQDFKYS